MNTMVVTDSVAPRQNDITLPDSVMNVMPTATQPMNDMVVSSENRLVAVRKPGRGDGRGDQRQHGGDADREQLALAARLRQAEARRDPAEQAARSWRWRHAALMPQTPRRPDA